MPRLTQQQLREAKQKKLSTTEQAATDKLRSDGLLSVVTALHVEVDKLARKAPSVSVSELTLVKANRAIRNSVEFLRQEGVEFVEGIEEFVPAGDMPEYRDMVLVLAEVKAGIERYQKAHQREWNRLLLMPY
jgi:hypothetical protein